MLPLTKILAAGKPLSWLLVATSSAPQRGELYRECCHRPTSRIEYCYWNLVNSIPRWIVLCEHCYSRAMLGSEVIVCLYPQVIVTHFEPGPLN